MLRTNGLALAFAFFFASGPAAAATILVTDLGDTAGSCPSATSCTLRAAIAAAQANDRIEFDPAFAYPATLPLLGAELAIAKSLTLAGPGAGKLTVTAAAGRRVLLVQAGEVIIEGIAFSGGQALGTNGLSASAGTGAAGQSGGAAEGGCIRIQAGSQLLLDGVALRNCLARGGSGGNGGTGPSGGTSANDRAGGSGGAGGLVRGGAISTAGQLTLMHSSISNASALGGQGGHGGNGGSPTFGSGGPGGDGGNAGSAQGGAIYVAAGGALWVRNSSFAGVTLASGGGGDGGSGGSAGAGGSTGSGGDGGNAGAVQGGDVYLGTALALADIEFATLAPANFAPGLAGIPGGAGGVPGTAALRQGEALFAGTAARIRGSALMGTTADVDCFGAVDASGDNLDSDNSCSGFTLQASFAASFEPSAGEEGGRAAWRLPSGSAAIDAMAQCIDLAGAAVTRDQSGRARPKDGDGNGSALCDIGAIEASHTIFADGFEGGS